MDRSAGKTRVAISDVLSFFCGPSGFPFRHNWFKVFFFAQGFLNCYIMLQV